MCAGSPSYLTQGRHGPYWFVVGSLVTPWSNQPATDLLVDIKLDNIFVNLAQQGDPERFTDIRLGDCGGVVSKHPKFATEPGHLIGASFTRSPEAQLGLSWGTSTDIWSFGNAVRTLIGLFDLWAHTNVDAMWRFSPYCTGEGFISSILLTRVTNPKMDTMNWWHYPGCTAILALSRIPSRRSPTTMPWALSTSFTAWAPQQNPVVKSRVARYRLPTEILSLRL